MYEGESLFIAGNKPFLGSWTVSSNFMDVKIYNRNKKLSQ
jgi:hypothetical protein